MKEAATETKEKKTEDVPSVANNEDLEEMNKIIGEKDEQMKEQAMNLNDKLAEIEVQKKLIEQLRKDIDKANENISQTFEDKTMECRKNNEKDKPILLKTLEYWQKLVTSAI